MLSDAVCYIKIGGAFVEVVRGLILSQKANNKMKNERMKGLYVIIKTSYNQTASISSLYCKGVYPVISLNFLIKLDDR